MLVSQMVSVSPVVGAASPTMMTSDDVIMGKTMRLKK